MCGTVNPRPPQLAASFISNQACDVACWHETDLPGRSCYVRCQGTNGPIPNAVLGLSLTRNGLDLILLPSLSRGPRFVFLQEAEECRDSFSLGTQWKTFAGKVLSNSLRSVANLYLR